MFIKELGSNSCAEQPSKLKVILGFHTGWDPVNIILFFSNQKDENYLQEFYLSKILSSKEGSRQVGLIQVNTDFKNLTNWRFGFLHQKRFILVVFFIIFTIFLHDFSLIYTSKMTIKLFDSCTSMKIGSFWEFVSSCCTHSSKSSMVELMNKFIFWIQQLKI